MSLSNLRGLFGGWCREGNSLCVGLLADTCVSSLLAANCLINVRLNEFRGVVTEGWAGDAIWLPL